MNRDGIKYTLQNLRQRKLRSFLTVSSILIGITAIFAILSFGFGIQNYMDVLAAEAGIDKLYVMSKGVGAPGTDETFSLSAEDVDFIGKIKGIKEISGMYMKTGEIKHGKEKKFFFIAGMDMKNIDFIMEAFTIDIMKGRELKKGETGKVALGYLYQFENRIFKKPVKLGDKVEVNSNKVEVVGFYEEVGNAADDGNIYLTFSGFESIFPDSKDKFGYVMIQAEKSIDPGDLAKKIERKLRNRLDQEEGKETFYVQTFQDAMETFGNVINILNGILFLIAFISLIVASVNIMNTMYTSVLERTKEIGIMKSIGAQNKEIAHIYIFESGLLGMIGGIFGVVFGYIIAKIGGYMAATSGFAMLKPIFPLPLTIGCILFSFLVGAGSGLLPAIRASKLSPVDALRYE